jgi:hypothetical protein
VGGIGVGISVAVAAGGETVTVAVGIAAWKVEQAESPIRSESKAAIRIA